MTTPDCFRRIGDDVPKPKPTSATVMHALRSREWAVTHKPEHLVFLDAYITDLWKYYRRDRASCHMRVFPVPRKRKHAD